MTRSLAFALLALVIAAGCSHGRAPAIAAAPETAAAVPVPTGRIPIYSDAEVAKASSPHVLNGKALCQTCHREDAALRAEANVLCQKCHAGGHGNHPVDVVQKTGAEGIPLLAGGRVACHSCHDPHAVKLKPAGGLRMKADDLCVRCHKGHH